MPVAIRTILAATDFSEASRAAVQRAAALAAARGARLVVAHVVNSAATHGLAGSATMLRDALEEERSSVRRALEAACAESGASPLVLDGYPDEQIVEASRAEAADLVVVGSHGADRIERLLLGSVAENVVRASAIPVLVGRGAPAAGFDRVLVATDFSEPAEHALDLALELAAPRARVDVLDVVQLPAWTASDGAFMLDETLVRDLEDDARRRGVELLARKRRDGIDLRLTVQIGTPRDGILRALHEGQDLVALGTHGRRGFRRLLLGSVAGTVLRHAPCSVLITR
jgi:nucleotide-binding universal stress UspA family protein